MSEASTIRIRARLGAALQKQRLKRGLTQGQVSEFAGLSLKYFGEIERGEANTTLGVLERLAEAVGWDPMESLDGVREPLSEGVRVLLISEVAQLQDRLSVTTKWLNALDPALHPHGGLAPALPVPRAKKRAPRASRNASRRIGGVR